ncbi:MAG: hypothetical protein Q8O84_03150 [Nanoarchaeota archaeon]|nr:hypothetical protein [Nanoarchaeota archaeon]
MKKIFTLLVMSIFLVSLMGTAVLADDSNLVGDKALSVASEKSKASKGDFWNDLRVKLALNKQKRELNQIDVDGDVNEIRNALRATIMMEKKLEAHKEKFVEGHSKIVERQGSKMSEEKIARLNEAFSKIEVRTSEAQDRIDKKQENLIARYKILTGATDEEVDALMDELEAEVEAKFQN